MVQVGSPFTYFMFSKTVVIYLYICIDASRPSNENQIWTPYKWTLIFSIYTFLANTVLGWTKPLFKLILALFFKSKRRQSRVNSGLSGLSRPSRDSQLMTTNGKSHDSSFKERISNFTRLLLFAPLPAGVSNVNGMFVHKQKGGGLPTATPSLSTLYLP